jgi:epoxyqueuosine reductase
MHDWAALAADIQRWAHDLGFQQAGISAGSLDADEARLDDWLSKGHHGTMAWMASHGRKRSRPAELLPGTLRIISVRMDYGVDDDPACWSTLADGGRAYIARYALGRDYHKVLRARLQRLADRLVDAIGPFGYRVFVDSAPVLERALARDAGLGWIGKNTCTINTKAGSWFFLGELFTDLPLPVDTPATDHCGTCRRCIDVCPTQAIVAPYELDARRCISYLTIENPGAIPVAFRQAIGNRIFGCDDCQLVCPWNKFAARHTLPDFEPRHGLDRATLLELFAWDEATFLKRTEGSAIRRTGFEGWLRNLAVALGNAPHAPEVVDALRERATYPSELVREHVAWALAQQAAKVPTKPTA